MNFCALELSKAFDLMNHYALCILCLCILYLCILYLCILYLCSEMFLFPISLLCIIEK